MFDAALARPASAQAPSDTSAWAPHRSWYEGTAGSEVEQYLRLLALVSDRGAPAPVGARPWSADDIASIARAVPDHPWRGRFAVVAGGWRPHLTLLRPSARLIGNSGFPFGFNDGPVWAGRGLTEVVSGGTVLRAGPLTVRAEPVAFRAENNAFRLADNGQSGSLRYGDPLAANFDLPQRFGPHAYQRLDWGDSEARVDLFGVAAGLSNAHEFWGPARVHPVILGNNAPGFAHVFLGTSRPLNVGVGRVHGRVLTGKLRQSAYSAAPDSLAERLMAGAVVTFAPGGAFRGLELGGTRFFHRPWVSRGSLLESLRIPVNGLLFKRNKLNVDTPGSANFVVDNQISSVFARWAFPGGFEAYGEFGRDDAALDSRDLLGEPDHDTAYMLGVQRVVRRGAAHWTVFRAEALNARITHLDRVRPQALFGSHSPLVQGHTNLGQALNSAAGRGGGGASLAVDRYDPAGRTSLLIDRIVRLAPLGEGVASPRGLDVMHSVRVERVRFRRGVDVVTGGGLVYESNRDLRHDVVSLTASAGVRWGR